MISPLLRYSRRIAAGSRPNTCLAEQGVEPHAGQAAQLPVRRGGPAGLVVGDDELAVAQFEAVDDAAQVQPVDLRAEGELEADRLDGLRVFHAQVVVDERPALGEQLLGRVVGEAQPGEVGELAVLGDGLLDRRRRTRPASARAAGWEKASSRARWTSEPRVVWIDGGSSIFSMLTKRNSIGHDVNASTRLGDRLVGTSYVVTPSS